MDKYECDLMLFGIKFGHYYKKKKNNNKNNKCIVFTDFCKNHSKIRFLHKKLYSLFCFVE